MNQVEGCLEQRYILWAPRRMVGWLMKKVNKEALIEGRIQERGKPIGIGAWGETP